MATLTNSIPNHPLIGKVVFDLTPSPMYLNGRLLGFVKEVCKVENGHYLMLEYQGEDENGVLGDEYVYITLPDDNSRYLIKP